MQIHIINRAQDVERRARMALLTREIGLAVSFFPAIDGQEPNEFVERHIDQTHSIREIGRPLSAGEAGCYASHFLLWQQCVAANSPLVIMEDDVAIDTAFGEVLAMTQDLLRKHPLIRLSGIFARRCRTVSALPNGYRLVRYPKGPRGAQCYALSPEGARRLLAHSHRWIIPVDDYIDQFWVHGVPSLAVVPFVVRPAAGIASVIGPSRFGARPTFSQKISREWHRLCHEARRWLYNFRAAWRARS